MVFYKQPQTELDEDAESQYAEIYQTFLEGANDTLEFYRSAPALVGDWQADAAVDLQAIIDRSLWMALLAVPNVDPATVRAKLANQTLALGIYPTNECAGKDLEPRRPSRR